MVWQLSERLASLGMALVKTSSHVLEGKFLRLDVVWDSRLADGALQQGLLHAASVTRMVPGPVERSRPTDGPRLHALASQALGWVQSR